VKVRAAPRTRGCPETSPMGGDEEAADAQPHAQPLLLRRKEGREGPLTILLGEPDPRVLDGDAGPISILLPCPDHDCGGADAGLGDRLDSVEKQVE
jgi:hypothetical protein